MGWHPDRLTLAERSALSGAGAYATPSPPAAAPASSAGGRHCWVVASDQWPGRHPGVLVEWRKEDGLGWHGRVAFVVDDGGLVIEAWLPAAALRPGRGDALRE